MKKLWGLVLGLALLAWTVSPAFAAVAITKTLQSAAAATGNGSVIELNGKFSSLAMTVTITNTATVTFEGTEDGSTWASLSCMSIASTSGAQVTTASATGTYQCPVAGMTWVRARVSAFTNGTVTVTATASDLSLSRKGGGGVQSGTEFPSSPATGQVFVVTDDSAVGACDSNAGASKTLCFWNGSSWEKIGDGTLASGLASTDIDTCAELAVIWTDETGTCGSPVLSVSPTLTTPNLGTPSAVTLTNGTGLPISGLSGLGAGVGTFLATPSSGNLASALTNETGSGSVVFGTAPTIDAPVITTSILLPNGTAVPGTCSIGMIYFDNDATAGVNLYGCTASNTWTLLGDGGGGGSIGGSTGGTDNAVLRANGTGGATIQATSVIIDDTDNISGAASIQFGSNPGDAGRVRLSNNEQICWEAATPGTDLCINLNTSNEFEFNAPLNITGTAGPLLMTGVASPSAPGTAEQWYFYADSVDDLPKYIYNGGSEVTFYTTANPQTTITGNAGTASTLAANPSDCAANNFATTIAANGDLTCSQPSISAGVSGLGTGVATALGTNANATGGVATTDGSATFTNKTLDCGGTGNTCTIKQERYFEVAGCSGTTAGHVWNAPTSNAAAATCDTNSNVWSAYLAFDAATDESIHGSFRLPTGYTGGIDWLFRYKMASATSGAVGWCVQLVRLPTGAAGDPALPAQAAGNCVSQTVPGTAGYESEATISSATCTSCAAGDRVFFRISRDADGGAVTDSATGDAYLVMSGPAFAVGY